MSSHNKDDHNHDNDNGNDDDYDDIPLQHQRPFGAGLHRRPIAFVSALGGGQLKSVDDTPANKPQTNVADLYLSMVLPKEEDTTRSKSAPPTTSATTPESPPTEVTTCPVCNLPLTANENGSRAHAQSLAHQLCLPHSNPPSALDRSRMGLAYLSAYGWDPDARKGLGAAQQGIPYPVKAKARDDRLGLGVEVPKGLPSSTKKVGSQGQGLLDAKKVRKMAAEERKRAVRIREELFGDGKIEKYLGKGAG